MAIPINQANQLTIQQLQGFMATMYQNGGPLHWVLVQGVVQMILAPDFNPADLAPLMTGQLDGVDPVAFVGAVKVLYGADHMLQTPDPATGLIPLAIMGEVVRRPR
jgi:hypothetical protein